MPRTLITRLFAYAREHQEQARTIGNDFRVEQWNQILDQLIDRRAGAAQ